MDTSSWTWIVLIAVVAACFIPMLFMMGKGTGRRGGSDKRDRELEKREGGRS